MQTHLVGAITGTRQGSAVTQQSFSLDYVNNLTGVDLLLCTVKASPQLPVKMDLRAIIGTADNSGTTSVLRVGSAANGAQYLNDVDLKGTAGVNYTTGNVSIVLVADTTIYARITRVGTAATAGQVFIAVDLAEININQPTAQGS